MRDYGEDFGGTGFHHVVHALGGEEAVGLEWMEEGGGGGGGEG